MIINTRSFLLTALGVGCIAESAQGMHRICNMLRAITHIRKPASALCAAIVVADSVQPGNATQGLTQQADKPNWQRINLLGLQPRWDTERQEMTLGDIHFEEGPSVYDRHDASSYHKTRTSWGRLMHDGQGYKQFIYEEPYYVRPIPASLQSWFPKSQQSKNEHVQVARVNNIKPDGKLSVDLWINANRCKVHTMPRASISPKEGGSVEVSCGKSLYRFYDISSVAPY